MYCKVVEITIFKNNFYILGLCLVTNSELYSWNVLRKLYLSFGQVPPG